MEEKDPLPPGARKIFDQTRSKSEELQEAEDSFSYRGHQVRIEIAYPHGDRMLQAMYAFLVDGERRGTAYLPEHAAQQAKTFIDKTLGDLA